MFPCIFIILCILMALKEIATFAGGCFWCTEAIFLRVKGVEKVVSGFAGGETEHPSYSEVSSGESGHAEAIQITFDPKVISYKDLLFIFFRTHDPTTLNRQGADVGPQYRSMILYHNENQKEKALKARKEIHEKAVTEIVPFVDFYEADESHQDYHAKNVNKQYCKLVIDPKIKKLQKNFKEYLKD